MSELVNNGTHITMGGWKSFITYSINQSIIARSNPGTAKYACCHTFLSLRSEPRQEVKMSLFFVTFSILLFSSTATPIENHNKTLSSDDIEIIDSACKLRVEYIE